MTSFVEFSRLLRELDEHKNKSIALPQFRKALGLMRVELAEEVGPLLGPNPSGF